jgi:hypothetical protein
MPPKTPATFFPLKYSPTKKATGKEKGKQINRASTEVIKVPAMKARAPYCSVLWPVPEIHLSEKIKPKNPNSLKAGTAPLLKEKNIPAKISKRIKAETRSKDLKILSDISSPNYRDLPL